MNDKILLRQEWKDILQMDRTSPYVFRTRLERAILHLLKYARDCENSELLMECHKIQNKLKYISDQSNQTSDGTLNSFIILYSDMQNILKNVG